MTDRFSISYSSLKMFDPPAKYKYFKEHPSPPSGEMATGSAVHCLVLEPATFEDRYEIIDVGAKNAKIWKEAMEINSLRASKGEPTKTLLTTGEFESVTAISNSVKNHDAMNFLSGGVSEGMYFWEEKVEIHTPTSKCWCGKELKPTQEEFDTQIFEKCECGGSYNTILCKFKPDHVNDFGVSDLKTVQSVDKMQFFWDARKRLYHMQASFYLKGMQNPLDFNLKKADLPIVDRFFWVAVEKNPPYLVRMFTPEESMLVVGEGFWRNRLEAFKECYNKDEWPGFTDIVSLSYDFK